MLRDGDEAAQITADSSLTAPERSRPHLRRGRGTRWVMQRAEGATQRAKAASAAGEPVEAERAVGAASRAEAASAAGEPTDAKRAEGAASHAEAAMAHWAA